MNAYELADELTKMFQGDEYDRLIHEIPDVLRQQADRIAELEKGLELVKDAYCARDSECKELKGRIAELEKQNSNLKYEISSGAWQPKEATDQELFNVYAHLQDTYEGDNFPVALGRTILKLYTTPQTKPLSDEQFKMNEELRWMAGEAECVKLCLDREGVPTEDGGGVLSLWGRVCNRAKPLSDEEIMKLWYESLTWALSAESLGSNVTHGVYFARAIEAKVREEK